MLRQRKPHPTEKENVDSEIGGSGSESDEPEVRRKAKKAKTQVFHHYKLFCVSVPSSDDLHTRYQPPKASNIDPEKRPVNDNIKRLRNRWTCHKKPGCDNEFCYVNAADGGAHVLLNFACLDCWVAAMVVVHYNTTFLYFSDYNVGDKQNCCGMFTYLHKHASH